MNSLVANVVDRLHVSASHVDVVRAIRRAFTRKTREARDLKPTRKRLYAEGIQRHEENRRLYRLVVHGGFSQ